MGGNMENETLSVSELAECFQMTKKYIGYLIRNDKLPFYLHRKKRRFRVSEIIEWLDERHFHIIWRKGRDGNETPKIEHYPVQQAI
ncbi:DNA-binding protein [Candidatus Parcubacteria bacterium]|nr:MAG: DNA-binding protein [Candidatus Parcubacteria bacterium]